MTTPQRRAPRLALALLLAGSSAPPPAAASPAAGPGACGPSNEWKAVSARPELAQRLAAAGVDEAAWAKLEGPKREDLCRVKPDAGTTRREPGARPGAVVAETQERPVSEVNGAVTRLAQNPKLAFVGTNALTFGRLTDNTGGVVGDVPDPLLGAARRTTGPLAPRMDDDRRNSPGVQRPRDLGTDLDRQPPPEPGSAREQDQPGWLARQWGRVERFGTGFANAFSHDTTLGAVPRLESDSRALRWGQTAGDAAALLFGTATNVAARAPPVIAGVGTGTLAFVGCETLAVPAMVGTAGVGTVPATAACGVGSTALGMGVAASMSKATNADNNPGPKIANQAAANLRGGGRPQGPLTGEERKQLESWAKANDFRKINPRIHGQPIFFDGRRYITPDTTAHSSVGWKVLTRQGDAFYRGATYNADLSVWIKD